MTKLFQANGARFGILGQSTGGCIDREQEEEADQLNSSCKICKRKRQFSQKDSMASSGLGNCGELWGGF